MELQNALKWSGALTDPSTDTSVKNIIFDSDSGPDSDDTAALTMLLNYANLGKVNLLATVCDTSTPYGALYLDAINTYYGHPEVLGCVTFIRAGTKQPRFTRLKGSETGGRFDAEMFISTSREKTILGKIMNQVQDFIFCAIPKRTL